NGLSNPCQNSLVKLIEIFYRESDTVECDVFFFGPFSNRAVIPELAQDVLDMRIVRNLAFDEIKNLDIVGLSFCSCLSEYTVRERPHQGNPGIKADSCAKQPRLIAGCEEIVKLG